MKKLRTVSLAFMLALIFQLHASVLITYEGAYNNDHISLFIKHRHSSGIMGGPKRKSFSNDTVIFEIKAKPGYRIVRNSGILFKNNAYMFQSEETRGTYIHYGKIEISAVNPADSVVTLNYIISKNTSARRFSYTRQLKITRNTETPGKFGGQIKEFTIKEI